MIDYPEAHHTLEFEPDGHPFVGDMRCSGWSVAWAESPRIAIRGLGLKPFLVPLRPERQEQPAVDVQDRRR